MRSAPPPGTCGGGGRAGGPRPGGRAPRHPHHPARAASLRAAARGPGEEPSTSGGPGAGWLGAAAAAAVWLAPGAGAGAADFVKTGQCVLGKCQVELARCLADEKCLENLVCLNGCAQGPAAEEASCQIKCGDLYADKAVAAFNTCAVTNKNCVPQKTDDGMYMVPEDSALVPEFDTRSMEGRWYITAGLNPLFDTFDCQEHFFTAPEAGKLYGKLKWRVKKPNGQFIERNDVQTFVQDPRRPGILLNHDNEFLHYQDDWFLVASEPEKYVAVYYRGSNDAWDGYGGAVVYTRAPSLPAEYVPELRSAFSKVGIRWEEFALTDNTCGPEPRRRLVRPQDLDTLVEDVEELEDEAVGEAQLLAYEAEKAIEDKLVSFGPGFTVLKREMAKEERALSQEVRKAAKALEKIEQGFEEKQDLKKGGLFLFGDLFSGSGF